MKLSIITLVLDGSPWIQKHLPVFQQLKCDWKWIVVHGAAMNNGSTSWCKLQEPRLSKDGTTEYLHSICDQITLLSKPRWNSKDEMMGRAVDQITEPCVLMEIDSDELWTVDQLNKIVELFNNYEDLGAIKFPCRFFVGENLITQGENCYGDMDYEWWRAWRFILGMTFKSHEPPVLEGTNGLSITKELSRSLGLVFDHKAYATEAQVRYKQDFYGYDGLLEGWKRLQEVTKFPVRLSDYFPQVQGDLPLVVKLNGLG